MDLDSLQDFDNIELDEVETDFEDGDIEVLAEGFGRQFVKDTTYNYYYTKVDNGFAVLLKEKNQYIFVKQFRPAVNTETIELIYGSIRPDEDAMMSAVREVKEATGMGIKGINKIGNFCASPSNLSEEFVLFIAEVDSLTGINLDFEYDPAKPDLVRLNQKEIIEMIKEGRLMLGSVTVGVLFDILVNR